MIQRPNKQKSETLPTPRNYKSTQTKVHGHPRPGVVAGVTVDRRRVATDQVFKLAVRKAAAVGRCDIDQAVERWVRPLVSVSVIQRRVYDAVRRCENYEHDAAINNGFVSFLYAIADKRILLFV